MRVIGLDKSSVNLRAWAFAKNPTDGFTIQCELLLNIKKRFDENSIEIP